MPSATFDRRLRCSILVELGEGVAIVEDLLPWLVVGGLVAWLLSLLPVVVVVMRHVILVIAIAPAASPTIVTPSLLVLVAASTVSALPTIALVIPVAAVEPIVAIRSSSLVVRASVTTAAVHDFKILARLLLAEGH